MNSDFKRVATSFGAIALATGAACAAATTASGAIMTGVVSSMLTGLATNLVDRGEYGRLKKLLIKTKPSDLNQDLEKLLSEAVIWTLRNIGQLYRQKMRFDFREEKLRNTIKELVEEVKAADRQGLLGHQTVVQQLDEAGGDEQLINELFARVDQLPTIDPDCSFPEFFKQKFVSNLQLCFGELLKDPKNRSKLIAYQRNVMQTIQQNTQALLQEQNTLQQEFADLREEVAQVLQKLDEKVQDPSIANSTQQLELEIETYLQPLHQKVSLLVTITGEIREDVRDIKEIVTEIRDQVSDGNTAAFDKYLGKPPYFTDVFLGREHDLEAIYQKLFYGDNLLLLVNGRGGIGKTTVAAQYYLAYREEYDHLAWVFAEQSIAEALLTLAISLKVDFEPTQTNEERLDVLLNQMRQLNEPCLLVVDNANRLADLEKYYPKLRSCPNFHMLLTTRITEFEQAVLHHIESLNDEEAITLFTKYYTRHQSSEDDLLRQILTAIGKNTLVIELLAKNLQKQNRLKTNYHLQELLKDLQQKGLLKIKSRKVRTRYRAEEELREEKPEDIIAAMYDLGELTEAEQQMISMMAVLPAENVPFNTLEQLLPEVAELDATLLSLSQQGWLDFNEVQRSFKISPVVQEVVRKKNKRLREACQPLIEGINKKLDYEPNTRQPLVPYKEAIVYAHYGEHLTNVLKAKDFYIWGLSECLGSFYTMNGNLNSALKFYFQCVEISEAWYKSNSLHSMYIDLFAASLSYVGDTYLLLDNPNHLNYFLRSNQLIKELYKTDTENIDVKLRLAASHQFLGKAYFSFDLQKAFEQYKYFNSLCEELYTFDSKNVDYKRSLAISYQYLGNVYFKLGDQKQQYKYCALKYYGRFNRISKDLYESRIYESNSDNIHFKNNLAISYSKMGKVYMALGKIDKAINYMTEDNNLSEELYSDYPQNLDFKYGLASSHHHMGNLHTEKGDFVTSHSFYRKAQELLNELVERLPDDVRLKNELNRINEKLK